MQRIKEYIESLGFIPIDDDCFSYNEYFIELTYGSINVYQYEISRQCKLISFAKRKDEILWRGYLRDLIKDSEAIALNNLKSNVKRYVEVLSHE